jgi:hypothetical protein
MFTGWVPSERELTPIYTWSGNLMFTGLGEYKYDLRIRPLMEVRNMSKF